VNVPETRSLVPPRPNLGPEPSLDSPPRASVWTAVAISALLILLIAVGILTLMRRARRLPKHAAPVVLREPDDTPRGHFVALSQSIRETLTSQFGTSWRAKTTEELSSDGELEQVLGKEPLEELIRFLDQVDRLKFAPERPSHQLAALDDELAAWKPRVADLLEKLRAKANGRVKNTIADNGTSGARDGRSPANKKVVAGR
jgi:hypothetical protein